MKKLTILFITLVLLILAFTVPKNTYAEVPDVKVRVINAVTGAPINGVWVRQANSPDEGYSTCQITPPAQSYRYERTDSSGVAAFSGDFWKNDYSEKWKINSPIDTNLDGTNDAVYIGNVSGIDTITGEPCGYVADFGCGQNPHVFSVVMPAGWTGSFSSVADISFNNIGGEFSINLEYTPRNTPTPTPSAASSFCDQNCSEKSVGTLDKNTLVFSPVSTLNDGQSYYIRLKLNNQNPGQLTFPSRSLGAVRIDEEVVYNALYLQSPVSNDSFILTRVRGGQSSEQNVSTTLCPSTSGGPSCVSDINYDPSNSVIIGYSVTLPSVEVNDTYYAYYKIIVRDPVVDEYRDTFLDSSVNSVISYLDLNITKPLDNIRIRVSDVNSTPSPAGTVTSKKEIGTIPSLGSFIPATTVNQNEDYWVKITINNNSDGQYSEVELHELLNASYFSLLNPVYTGSKDTSTFFIEDYAVNGSQKTIRDNTNGLCNNLSCIQRVGSKLIVKPSVGLQGEYDTFIVYLKVRAILSSAGNPINVDIDDKYPAHTGSYIDFTNRPNTEANEPPLDNVQTIVCPIGGCVTANSAGYFQVVGGNAYSNYSGSNPPIFVSLPPNTKFLPEQNPVAQTGILIQRDPDAGSFGAGGPTDSNWYLKSYTNNNNVMSYEAFYRKYVDRPILEKNISGINQFSDGAGYYIDQTSISSKKYTVTGGGWANQILSGKQAVLFVPGDLYINENINIAANGNSSLTFIVSGNVGISPSVTEIDGIFFVDGSFDTACDSSLGFAGAACSSGSANLSRQLILEGTYYSGQGFILNRNAAQTSSELFKARPDFILGALSTLGQDVFSWKEVVN